ncbi:MAG TPA: TRAP transporter substrate-binding protein DctP [Saprospiraceae bacterium]|nr:TRAP transporter substrate-binding protein DctP [Saprospiraceae bacterium]
MKRKQFLKKATLGALAIAGVNTACNSNVAEKPGTPHIITDRKYKWKLVTTWPPNFPVMGEGCIMLAQWIREMSGGRLEINVYGGGELIPALESFEAVSSGAVEMGHGAAYYWAGKHPATQFFTAVPFGMNAQQMNAWLYSGGGMELWQELYGNFNMITFPAGNTGVQMGGWFNREINALSDLKGLKMRIPGMGGKVFEKAGGTAVLSAGSEIYTNLERGVIDAAEWVGPYHDFKMGFHEIGKYYYAPGWQEPGPALELFVNRRAYDRLSPDLQMIIQSAAYRLNIWTLSVFEAQNNLYLQKILNETKVSVRIFSQGVLEGLKKFSDEVIDELIHKDPFSSKVMESYSKFQKDIGEWAYYSEKLYYNLM